MIDRLAKRFAGIKPRMSAARFLRELAECEQAQRRATIARRRQEPGSLTEFETLWLAARRAPDRFPPYPVPRSSLCDW